MRKINKIVFHVSDSPDDLDIGVDAIREWHVKGRGFSDVGYHFVVRRNGVVEDGRPLYRIGAHVEGQNSNSIGIVWVGRDHMTDPQKTSLIKKISDLMTEFKLEVKDVYGHREFNPHKTCPNFDPEIMRQLISDYRKNL